MEKKKKYKPAGRPTRVSKESLYQEFIKNKEMYPSLKALHDKYYADLMYPKASQRHIKEKKLKHPDPTFYNMARGFIKRREDDIRKQTDEMLKQQAKEEAKSKAKLELKDYALGTEGYLSDFRMVREALRYALKRTHLLMQAELEKIKKDSTYIPKPISLSKGELSQIRAYRQFYQSMRTSLKLPVQYTVNYEEQDTQNSVGGLLKTIAAYKKAGGDFDEDSGKEVERVDVEFKRE